MPPCPVVGQDRAQEEGGPEEVSKERTVLEMGCQVLQGAVFGGQEVAGDGIVLCLTSVRPSHAQKTRY